MKKYKKYRSSFWCQSNDVVCQIIYHTSSGHVLWNNKFSFFETQLKHKKIEIFQYDFFDFECVSFYILIVNNADVIKVNWHWVLINLVLQILGSTRYFSFNINQLYAFTCCGVFWTKNNIYFCVSSTRHWRKIQLITIV